MGSSAVNPAWIGPFSAFMSSITWAIGTAGYSRLSKNYSAFSVSFARSLIAMPLFFITTFLVAGGWESGWADFRSVTSTHVLWFAVSMFASYGFGDVLFLFSTKSLGVPGALAIASSYPLWTALAGVVFKGEYLTIRQTFGLCLTILGAVIVILKSGDSRPTRDPADSAEGKKAQPVAVGIALAMTTSFLWALNGVAVSKGAQGLTLPVSNTLRMAWALVLCAFFCRTITPSSPILLPKFELRKLWWLFALEAFGGSCFFTYGMANSQLAVGSTLSSLAPVISVPVTLALGLEKFSLLRTLGVCLVVMGLAFLVLNF